MVDVRLLGPEEGDLLVTKCAKRARTQMQDRERHSGKNKNRGLIAKRANKRVNKGAHTEEKENREPKTHSNRGEKQNQKHTPTEVRKRE